jgi:hypothetical protein
MALKPSIYGLYVLSLASGGTFAGVFAPLILCAFISHANHSDHAFKNCISPPDNHSALRRRTSQQESQWQLDAR